MADLISREDLRVKLGRGDKFVLVDTLPWSAYRKSHLPGAINIPSDAILADASARISDRDADIVVYCGNGPCKRSSLSADRLRQLGYSNVRDYHAGKADWIAAGLPVVEGEIEAMEAADGGECSSNAAGADRSSRATPSELAAANFSGGTPDIRDLAAIGDRRTAAVLDRMGRILWYCPERFDRPSLFAGLLDPGAGAWEVQLPDATPGPRRYLGDSGVLESRLCTSAGELVITDFMPDGEGAPKGLICRRFSSSPEDAHIVLDPRPDYARREPRPVHAGDAVLIDRSLHLYSSHPLSIDERSVSFVLPKGEEGWAVLSDRAPRLGGDVIEARRYLDFICGARGSSSKYPLAVFTNLDGHRAPGEEVLDLAGYLGSRPVRIGNDARDQLQLDAFANVLLAAKLIYQHTDERPHWDAVEEIAELLVEHWREPDYGIWEESTKLQYTANKVVVACALSSVAEFAIDETQAARWRTVVQDIRDFVASHCLTSEGAYAVHAGSEEVDVSAALIPIWGYTAADTPEMQATMAALERDYSWEGLLYWRHLEDTDSHEEGTFLAGAFWVAQYWIMRGDLRRAQRIMDAGLSYANDVGLLSEEADPRSGLALGNIPQAFVHAAFIGAELTSKQQ